MTASTTTPRATKRTAAAAPKAPAQIVQVLPLEGVSKGGSPIFGKRGVVKAPLYLDPEAVAAAGGEGKDARITIEFVD